MTYYAINIYRDIPVSLKRQLEQRRFPYRTVVTSILVLGYAVACLLYK